MQVIRQIKAYYAGRDPERLKIKCQKIGSASFAFLRVTCHRFYDRWASVQAVKSAPVTWLFGDLHLENFGSFEGNNRLAYFDLNDFDEAALAPASWEFIRMLTSLRVAWCTSIRGKFKPRTGPPWPSPPGHRWKHQAGYAARFKRGYRSAGRERMEVYITCQSESAPPWHFGYQVHPIFKWTGFFSTGHGFSVLCFKLRFRPGCLLEPYMQMHAT